MIFDSVAATIGRTPIIRLNRMGPKDVALYGKVEFFNPGGSVKDRLAIAIIEDAEQRGDLKQGQTVIEATSGLKVSTTGGAILFSPRKDCEEVNRSTWLRC